MSVRGARSGWCLGILAAMLAAALPAQGADPVATYPRLAREVEPVILHLTWNAPYGDPRARATMIPACSDTTRLDTLWLSFESRRRGIEQLSVSGTLWFEPQLGDTLGSFWHFERGAQNAGNIFVDFDLRGSRTPWTGLVQGHVGYTRAGSRGRLDLSANGPNVQGLPITSDTRYVFARIIISQRWSRALEGCGQPLAITWASARFPEYLRDQVTSAGPGRTVTWNPGPSGVRRQRSWLAVNTWTPVEAPPSRGAIATPLPMPKITVERPPEDQRQSR